MARGRPHGRSKSDHRVCQAARHAQAAEYRERIAISAEQQEARIAAVNAECNMEDAPHRRRGQKSKDPKIKASAARVSAQGHSSKATGSGKKKANKRMEHAHGKAAQRDLHSLHCHACGATAEFGLRGSKEGGSVKYSCRAHTMSNGCFRIDRDRAAWAEDAEMRRLRVEERRLEAELRQLGGASFAAKPTSARYEFPTTGIWASMHMSESLIEMLLTMGGVERNPGPTTKEEKELALKKSWQEVDSEIDSDLLEHLAKQQLTLERWRRATIDGDGSETLTELKANYPGDWLAGWTAIFKSAAGAGPLTSGDPAKGQLQGARLRISGTGEWSPAIADAIRQALDPTFRLLDSQGNLPIPCWTAHPEHPQAAHINRLAIPQWRGEPSLLLHALPEKGKRKGRSAADRLIAFILETRAKYAGQQTQLGRATFGLGVSGCGKTRTDLEALCGPWYGFYLSFSTAEEPGSNVLAAAVERFEGRFQGELTKLLEAGNQEGLKSYRRERLQDARKLVIRILLVEVLCLERFLMEYGEAATPRKYLMMQLIGLGKLEDWLVDAWSCVFDVSLEELKKELQRAVDHVKQLTEQDFLLVVVDEAHLGLKSLEDHFPNADNTEGRSLLNAWVRILNDAAFKGFHFLFTGTRLGMAEHDSLATAIGKGPGVPVIFSDYGINSTSQAKSFAMEYVPGDDCEDLLWELVAGRYRFAVELTKLRLADARLNWEGAANALKKRHTGDASSQRTLIGRLAALESKSKFYKKILHSLKVLVTDRYVMGVARAQYRKDFDLVELGFCHLVRLKDDEADENEEDGGAEVDESKGLWRMDMSEPLAAVAAKVYLERRGRWKQDSVVEQLMLKLDLPSPIGLLWDVYMPTALRKFFRPDKKLADHPLLKSIKGRLPASFFTHPQIVCLTKNGTVNKITDREGYKVRRGNEGFRFVDFAEDPRGITSFLPEDGAGPDVAHFVQLGEAEKENWFDILQAKLRPDYDLEHALKTVTLDLMYSGHPDREQLVARVKSALKEKRVKGVIRFVAAFPSTKTATTEVFHPEESKTRKEDMCTVQIGVSAENAHHFFGEEHLEILRSLKDAKKRAYSEIE